MTLVPVDKIPERKNRYADLQALIKEFVESRHEIVKIEYESNHYKKPIHAYKSWWNAVRISKYNVRLVKRGDDIYLVRVR